MDASLVLAVFTVFILSNSWSGSALEIAFTNPSRYIYEGQETVFTCAISGSINENAEYVVWTVDNTFVRTEEIHFETRVNITLSLNKTSSTLRCLIASSSEGKYATLPLKFANPPRRVALGVNATHFCENDTECSADVTIGRHYRFICNASGSNPASNITWLIDTKARSGMGRTEISPDWSQALQDETNEDWDTSSHINLQILPEHENITCVVQLQGITVRKISMLLNKPAIAPSTENPTPIPSAQPIQNIIIIATAAVLLGIVALTIVWRTRLCSRLRQKEERENTQLDENVALEAGSSRGGTEFSAGNINYNFPRGKIVLHEVLGSGNFGQVYRATADGIYSSGIKSDVAVKILKKSADADVVADFEKEIAVQKDLVKHPNIVSMLGYCTETEPFYLILEYISGGNLQNFLRGKKDAWRDDPVEGAQPACPFQLLTFASEIANGMDYLSTMGCIHRDLATRNILLSDDLVCKLSDFGLARDVSETEQYERTSLGLIPVRWLALECLVENTYTTMSDVWSFGVLLWEIVTLGAHPYRGMSASQIIDSLVEGFRLPTPAHCNKQLYTVMKECWRISPTRRPSFSNLKRILDIMIPDSQIYLAMEDFVADKYT